MTGFRPAFRSLFLLLVVAFMIDSAAPASAQSVATLSSPDGSIRVHLDLDDRGVPAYRVTAGGEAVVDRSRLGVVLGDGDTLGVGMEVVETQTSEHDETWTQPWGQQATVRDHHRELRVRLRSTSPPERDMILVFRAFNDGIGFRYEWPEQPELDRFRIMDERTEFRLAEDPTTWWIRAYEHNRYEYLYNETKLSEAGYALHTPLTMAFPEEGPFVALHEANLTDYAAMSLRRTGPTRFQADLAPWSNGVRVYGEAPFRSPWRTILIGDEPGDLVTNTMALNLNEPNQIEDTSWIEPGKYVGIWWAMHLGMWTWGSGPNHGATTEHAKDYIDFAAEHGFDGVLVEGWNQGWDGNWVGEGADFSFTEPYPDFDLEEVAAYARENGTRLIGHHETSGHVPNYEAQMEEAYDLLERLDVNALKTGYVDHGMDFPRETGGDSLAREWNYGQYMVRHYRRSIELAAEHGIMLDIHEPVKGTGLRRTYPNLMTQEGARGQEFNAPWGAGNGPDHVPTIVFTRLLAGPMDFTPGIFNLDAEGEESNAVPTTLAGQLALYVVLFSPLHMAADLPKNYEAHPDAFQFIKDVPTSWAETTVIDAAIGDHVTIARKDRTSDDWYLGAKTNGSARTVRVPLDFLADGTSYTAEIYRDGAKAGWKSNPMNYEIETRTMEAGDTLQLQLAPGGGAAVRFAPQSAE